MDLMLVYTLFYINEYSKFVDKWLSLGWLLMDKILKVTHLF